MDNVQEAPELKWPRERDKKKKKKRRIEKKKKENKTFQIPGRGPHPIYFHESK